MDIKSLRKYFVNRVTVWLTFILFPIALIYVAIKGIYFKNMEFPEYMFIWTVGLSGALLSNHIRSSLELHRDKLELFITILERSYFRFREYLCLMSDIKLKDMDVEPKKYKSPLGDSVDETTKQFLSYFEKYANTTLNELAKIRRYGVNNKSPDELQRYHSDLMSLLYRAHKLTKDVDIEEQVSVFSNLNFKE